METTSRILAAFSVALLVFALPVYGQPGALPCTPVQVNSFTPCINFLNNSTANVTTPTPDCCNSLKSLTTNSSGCFCSFVSGNMLFPFPINRTLAVSLPRACNMPGVPVQCKVSTTAPVQAPGPTSLPQTPSPSPAVSASPVSPSTPTPASDTPPEADTPASSNTPATTTPTAGSGGTTASSPSSAIPISTSSHFFAVVGLGMLSVFYA